MNESGEWLARRAPEVMFAACLAAAATILLVAGSGLVFFYDEWELVLFRTGFDADSLLGPHNGQLFVIPTLVYKTMLPLFGMGSQLPFRVLAVILASVCSVLLFAYARRRAGAWTALVATIPVMCLGAGWEALLLPLSMNFLISLAAGLGTLLVLERDDMTGDILASLLLGVSLAAGSLGLAFVVGAAVQVLLKRDLRRIWIVAIPLLLFGLWAVTYGSQAESQIQQLRVAAIPDNMWRSLSSVSVALTGITVDRRPGFWLIQQLPEGFLQEPGRLLACVVLVLVGIRVAMARRFPISREAMVAGAVLITFWVLTGLSNGGGREPEASRYMYPGAVLLVVFAAALLQGLKLPRWTPVILVPLVAYSFAASTIGLRDGHDFLMEQTEITRAAIGALDARGEEAAGLHLGKEMPDLDYLHYIDAEPYFEARGLYGGTVGYSPGEIRNSGPVVRQVAARVNRLIQPGPD